MKKRVLCYGDSNTWGYMPEGQPDGFHMRYPEDVRWTGVLANELGDSYVVVEEGLNGRTTSFDESGFRCRNGAAFLESSLLTHEPIDVVVIMLGTNDLKKHICGDPAASAESLASLLNQVRTSFVGPKGTTPAMLVIAPPHLGPGMLRPPFSNDYEGQATIDASKELASLYRQKAEEYGAEFIDASRHAAAGADGVHMTAEGHNDLGIAVADVVRKIIPVADEELSAC